MKAKTNELFEDFSGSTGGITATHSAGHLVVRNKVIPTYTDTDYQKVIRGNFSVYTKKWGELTDGQRQKWIEKAIEVSANKSYFGITGKISGFNLYVKCNINLKLVNVVAELTEPVRSLPQKTPTIDKIEYKEEKLTVKLSEIISAEDSVVIRVTPLKPGQSTNVNGLRQVGVILGGTDNIDVTEKFIEIFGNIVEGEKLQAQAYAINTQSGFASVRQITLTTITV